MLLNAFLCLNLIDPISRPTNCVLVILARTLGHVLTIPSHDLLRYFASSAHEATILLMASLSLRRHPLSIQIRVLRLTHKAFLLRHQHPPRLRLQVIAPSMILLQPPLRLPLPRRHLHTHQVLLLVYALANALVVIMLRASIGAARCRQ